MSAHKTIVGADIHLFGCRVKDPPEERISSVILVCLFHVNDDVRAAKLYTTAAAPSSENTTCTLNEYEGYK